MALDKFFHGKIESMKLEIIQRQAVLRRLEAQRNDYNSRVRLLREELGLLQQPGSYVGEVVKVMGTKKVLVKVHPEGKYGTFDDPSYILTQARIPNVGYLSRRHCGQHRHHKTHRWKACDAPLRFLQALLITPILGRPTCLAHDGREGPRQHIRHDRWSG